MIIPSIDISDSRAVQLRQGKEFALDGGDPYAKLEEFAIVGEVAIVDLDAAMNRGTNATLIRNMVKHAPCRVGGGIRDLESAYDWLDAGAQHIVIGTAATPEFCAQLPRERVIAAVDAVKGTVVVDGWQTKTGDHVLDRIRTLAAHVSGFLLTQVEYEGMLSGFDWELIEQAREAADNCTLTAAGGITSPNQITKLEDMGVDAQVGMALYTGQLSLGAGFSASLKGTGPVWPTVVCDEHGITLGLVWSSKESLAKAISERRGVYWSRSRSELWVKGATSGATQTLLRVDTDCDRDALRFTVIQQQPGFCHNGTRSCWSTTFGLSQLERVIVGRNLDRPDASGTTKLFEDQELLRAKLLEEAEELTAANNADEAVRETADVIYFALVQLIKQGGSLKAVEQELARRNLRVRRRPMASVAQKLKEIS